MHLIPSMNHQSLRNLGYYVLIGLFPSLAILSSYEYVYFIVSNISALMNTFTSLQQTAVCLLRTIDVQFY